MQHKRSDSLEFVSWFTAFVMTNNIKMLQASSPNFANQKGSIDSTVPASCGGVNRTRDLRDMSPPRYHFSTPQLFND